MLRRVVQNFTTRLATALLSFGVVWLTARYLGAAGRGAVSLFVTDCAAILLFIGLLGGSSLIYLAPRRNLWHLLLPAYGWATLVCVLGTGMVALLRQPEPSYLLHLGILSLLQAFFSINTALLLGRRREAIYNLLTLAQVALLAGTLLLAFKLGGRWVSVETYYYAAYLAFGLPLLLSLMPLLRLPDPRRRHGRRLRATTRELARHSRGAHFSNVLAFANYRLGYYFVAYFADARAVGVLSVGVALMEAIWLIPRSAALVQYVDLVNTPGGSPLPESALRVGRLAVLGTAAAVLVLVAVPPAVLTAVFGREFGPAQTVMQLLAPGSVMMAVQMLISSYFAGRAQYRINNAAAVAGLALTLAGGLLLIPRLGIEGAALASTLSYTASTAFLLWHFRRTTGLGITSFLPGRTDITRAWQLLRSR
ncbi:lipopolysaccharide biosynthesis protein [Hymenobacter lapidiphilus]|uniref:Polysaccharide biosynthesis C-terminal domain-containing protein n=1 Tax=Hymenobacter lapidiphilus TaxID=2608003 RepID=A0A7Y7U422_9BACT|nr:polysaccharide biosynthesis C-terminal domain-containing protein [Hymenobacter lapidiphilus]NVO30226.1 polysaccharide biosynthesis C-terminal domain-containing protein [Hymenobacter lapidiphilus]